MNISKAIAFVEEIRNVCKKHEAGIYADLEGHLVIGFMSDPAFKSRIVVYKQDLWSSRIDHTVSIDCLTGV